MDNPDFLVILVYDLLYRRKLSADEVVEQLTDAGREPVLVEEAIQTVHDDYKGRDRLNCRQVSIEDLSSNAVQNQKILHPASQDPFDIIMTCHIRYLLSIVFNERMIDEIPDDHMLPQHIRKISAELNDKFQVSDNERKFLRRVYLDGMKVGVAGKNAGWNCSVAKEKHRQLKLKLRKVFPKSTLRELISCFKNKINFNHINFIRF
jgi:hypothetical protein